MNEMSRRLLCKWDVRRVIRSCRIPIISMVLVLAGFRPEVAAVADAPTSDAKAWEFAVRRCSRIYPPRSFKGLLASDPGGRIRITIYWLQPPLICEKTDNLAYSDMIFQKDAVSCWLHKEIDGKRLFKFDLGGTDEQFRLPRQDELIAILKSVFGGLRAVRCDGSNSAEPWEMARFFQSGRNRNQFEHRAPSKADERTEQVQEGALDDSTIMNALPFGRVYRKKISTDNSYAWQIRKESANRDLVTLTIRPLSNSTRRDMRSAFDPNTLGTWSAVPEPYRRYWAFLRLHDELGDPPDDPSQAGKLYVEVNSYLGEHLPEDIRPVFGKLRFKIALMTGMPDAISHSAREYVAALCEHDERSITWKIVELGRVAASIRKRWSDEQTRDLVYPLLEGLIEPSIFANASFLQSMISDVKHQGWYWYDRLIIDILREKNCVATNVLDDCLMDLEMWRLSRHVTQADPNTLRPSMREFLTRLDGPPCEGRLTLEDLHHALGEGLVAGFRGQPDDKKREFIERVVASIRMIAGDGPFQADKDRLTESLIEFERVQCSERISYDSMHNLLTTFVALSFYDTSTQADHEELTSQLNTVCETLTGEICQILERHQLLSLVSREDIEKIFARPQKDIRRYVDDPLWPMFKYPLTENEQTRLINKIRNRLERVEHDARMAQRLSDGADSQLVRRRLMRDVVGITREIPYQAACIRQPRYPGVSCGTNGAVGLHVGMKGRFYDSPEKARVIFEKMKYFYLGHRIDGAGPDRP